MRNGIYSKVSFKKHIICDHVFVFVAFECIERVLDFLTVVFLYFLEQTAEEAKILREEKKRMLLRKLSFRPTIDELKEKKVRCLCVLHLYFYIVKLIHAMGIIQIK